MFGIEFHRYNFNLGATFFLSKDLHIIIYIHLLEEGLNKNNIKKKNKQQHKGKILVTNENNHDQIKNFP